MSRGLPPRAGPQAGAAVGRGGEDLGAVGDQVARRSGAGWGSVRAGASGRSTEDGEGGRAGEQGVAAWVPLEVAQVGELARPLRGRWDVRKGQVKCLKGQVAGSRRGGRRVGAAEGGEAAAVRA